MDKDSKSMRNYVWVGRVKSTVNPGLLADAFGKVGRVRKIETGFGGFAFVEYENEEDADGAIKEMHHQVLPHIGEIACDRATFKGYMGAIARRETYWKGRGSNVSTDECTYYVGDNKPEKGGISASPSPMRNAQYTRRRRPRSGSRSRSGSYSRSYSNSRRQARSRSRRRSRSRSRSCSRPRKCSPSPRRSPEKSPAGDLCERMRAAIASRKGGEEQGSAETSSVKRAGDADSKVGGSLAEAEPISRDVNGGASPQENLIALCERYVEPGLLHRDDRVAAVRFFESTNALTVLLEGADLVRLPASHVMAQLNAFPHGFQGLSHKKSLALLEVLSGFIRAANQSGKEMDVEVRQSLVVRPDGQRALRKAVAVNGKVCFKHEHPLE